MKRSIWTLTCCLMLITAVSGVAQDRDSSAAPSPVLSEAERELAVSLTVEALERRRLTQQGRTYLVDVTLVLEKGRAEEKEGRRLALVTHYRYEGDTALLSTVDLAARRLVSLEQRAHLAVPLAAEEFERAQELALSDRRVWQRLGNLAGRVEAEALVLRTANEDDPLFNHRAVRLMFRVGRDYLSQPIAIVDLTAGTVELEEPSTDEARRQATDRERGPLPGLAEEPVEPARRFDPVPPSEELPVKRQLRTCCPRHSSKASGNQVYQQFPPTGAMQTAWRVRFGHATGKGLFITGAWFKKAPTAPWMRVLWDARLADIFVPYHSGSPRYFDLTGFNFNLEPVVAGDLGCCGRKADDFVVREVRDRGILWKDDEQVRRGHELLLWATVDAANYNYIIQYGFRDDGTITFRLGATSRNLPGREMEAHMHNGLWRVDIDLNGFPHDSALLTRHLEPFGSPSGAKDEAMPFNDGHEGLAEWNALQFTGVRVVDTQTKNGKGEAVSYDLMPLRRGRPRHAETFSKQDFWVTRYHATELFYPILPTYVSDSESVTNTDIVLWHMSGAHHLPRREDGEFKGPFWTGSALVMWSGFDLRPRNLFDRTPLFP